MYILIYSFIDTETDKLVKSFFCNESKKEVKEFLNYHLNSMSESECFQYYFCNAKILKDSFHDKNNVKG